MPRRMLAFLSGLTDRLAIRLLLLLSLAILPLGVIAVHTTAEALRTARQGAERALIGLTAEALAGKRALIESALASGRALGPLALERIDDLDACRAMLVDYVDRSGVYSFAGFVEPDGRMRCTSVGDTFDFSASPVFQELRQRPRSIVSMSASGIATGEPVVIATQPIYSGGAFAGFLSISISQRSLQLMAGIRGEEAPRRAVLVNHAGALISIDPAIETAASVDLPAGVDLARLVAQGNRVFQARTGAGDRATFVVAELIPRRLYALGTWDEAVAGPTGWRAMVVPLLFPVLMWAASLGVLYFALYHQVIRHVRTLNRQMRRFALGVRDAVADLPFSAPSELRELGGTFRKMTWIIARDEAAREADLAEKTVLLKEVHHRVKNNLQLIASILNLQMRQLQDSDARAVLQSVQDRVLGLATIHRSLYEETQLSALRADRVLEDILSQILSVGVPPSSGIRLSTELEPMRLDPDRLVPLTLLLTEAVTNAVKHLGRPEGGGAAWLDIRLKVRDGRAELSLINSRGPRPQDSAAARTRSRLGNELIEAFAQQLGAELERGEIVDARGPAYLLTLRFPAESHRDADPVPQTEPEEDEPSASLPARQDPSPSSRPELG